MTDTEVTNIINEAKTYQDTGKASNEENQRILDYSHEVAKLLHTETNLDTFLDKAEKIAITTLSTDQLFIAGVVASRAWNAIKGDNND